MTKKNLIIGIIVTILLISGIVYWGVREEAKKQDDNQGEQQEQKQAQNLSPISKNDHLIGDLNAPVQMIIYSDFECPYCARFVDTIEKVKAEFGDKIAITFRHFPLAFHKDAMPAAIASECAAEQGKFWEMHDKLFEDNEDKKFSIAEFKNDAKELGLDQAKFNQCLETDKYKEKVQKQMLEGKSVGVTGTPTTFVNGEFVIGAIPFEDYKDSEGRQQSGMKKIIERKLK
ncbi:MAG: thioredoxin domain-containing protein [Patescibacteria group bacterium]